MKRFTSIEQVAQAMEKGEIRTFAEQTDILIAGHKLRKGKDSAPSPLTPLEVAARMFYFPWILRDATEENVRMLP